MAGRKFGYARVSSSSQNLDRQIISPTEYVDRENIIVDRSQVRIWNEKDIRR